MEFKDFRNYYKFVTNFDKFPGKILKIIGNTPGIYN
jgi:hypothetical protein